MLLLHMQEIVFVDSQEGLLSSRGGGGRHTGTRLTVQCLPGARVPDILANLKVQYALARSLFTGVIRFIADCCHSMAGCLSGARRIT